MRRGTGTALVVVGIVIVAFGLLFLVGSAGMARRLATAAVLLVGGAVAAGFGLRGIRRADAVRPELLEAAILELARREDGEISREEIEAALGWRAEHAWPVLDRMALEGRCLREARGGTFHYRFPDLQPRLVLLVCDYCGAEYPLNPPLTTCPACGGPVSRRIVTRSLAGKDLFAMDGTENGSDGGGTSP